MARRILPPHPTPANLAGAIVYPEGNEEPSCTLVPTATQIARAARSFFLLVAWQWPFVFVNKAWCPYGMHVRCVCVCVCVRVCVRVYACYVSERACRTDLSSDFR